MSPFFGTYNNFLSWLYPSREGDVKSLAPRHWLGWIDTLENMVLQSAFSRQILCRFTRAYNTFHLSSLPQETHQNNMVLISTRWKGKVWEAYMVYLMPQVGSWGGNRTVPSTITYLSNMQVWGTHTKTGWAPEVGRGHGCIHCVLISI